MKKVYQCLIIIFSIHTVLFAQDLEKEILQSIYSDIKKQNQNLMIKKSLNTNEIRILADPVTLDEIIWYSEEIDTNDYSYFFRLSEKEQKEILMVNEESVLPLKDTLCIIDTQNYFSNESIVINSQKGEVIIIRNSIPDENCRNCLRFFGIINKENYIVAFLSMDSKYFHNYYLDVNSGSVTIKRRTYTKVKATYE